MGASTIANDFADGGGFVGRQRAADRLNQHFGGRIHIRTDNGRVVPDLTPLWR